MPERYHIEPKKCSRDGCTKSYTPHHWGAKRAESEGWFLQKNGDAWCPDHNPDWVAAWRARRKKKES